MAHVIAEVESPDGRTIRLDSRTWDHVRERHPEMRDSLEDIMRAIERPQHREPDPRPGRVRYYGQLGRQAWIRVVTEFAGPTDRVVTAFLEFSDPRVRADR